MGELPDGELPGLDQVGNFVIGPSHPPAPELEERTGVPRGDLRSFELTSHDSVVYPTARVRDEESFNETVWTAPVRDGDPSDLHVTTSRPGTWTRSVTLYTPAARPPPGGYPVLVVGDGEVTMGGGAVLARVLDNLISDGRVPAMAAVLVGSGGQDAQGSQRGREYDEVSGTYAHFVESEVLPAVERTFDVALTRDPEGRAVMGGSSSGVAAFTMAWFRPDRFRRVVAYSPTFINQQWPHDPALAGGAWEYHSPWAGRPSLGLAVQGFAGVVDRAVPSRGPLVVAAPRRPIRFWFAVGDRDLFYPVPAMVDGMHDWVLAAGNMAKVLAAQGYEYQFVFARNADHVDRTLQAQTLPTALEWVWRGYEPE